MLDILKIFTRSYLKVINYLKILKIDVSLDEHGYPKYLQIGQSVSTFNTRDVKAHFPAGKYICLLVIFVFLL
jgi:hypothetical protein